jgi:hypothetical protein
MTWIKIQPPSRAHPEVAQALKEGMAGYPPEYQRQQTHGRLPAAVARDNVVLAHSLIPQAMKHVSAAYGAMLDPALPLSRRQHEMIAATVSALNQCFY